MKVPVSKASKKLVGFVLVTKRKTMVLFAHVSVLARWVIFIHLASKSG